MTISDTCRHVLDTFLHVPCPCLQFRNLPPLPASLYPPFTRKELPQIRGTRTRGRNSLRNACLPLSHLVPVLHGWMQFPWIPDDPLMYVWLLCGFLQPPRSIAQPPPNYVKRVCIPMHSLQPSHWMVEITSSIYTFLHVPCYPSIGSLKSCPESIRSCTFCATLPIILCHRVLNLYVPIRSAQPSHNSVK
jgi:hypothetical protein